MNKLELMRAAAWGDMEAQSALANEACLSARPGWMSPEEASALAEPFAQMAAMHGGTPERLTLLGILLMRTGQMRDAGRTERYSAYLRELCALAEELIAEGNEDAAATWAAVLDGQADAGDETAAARLAQLEAQFGPEIIKRAAALRRKTQEVGG